jgi:hypothetical protein
LELGILNFSDIFISCLTALALFSLLLGMYWNLRKAVLCIAVLASAFTTMAQPKAYWQQQVDYDMAVTLNDANHSLDGFAKITYHNQSPDTLRFIWFHLWPNAYKNDQTAFSEQLLKNRRTDFYFSKAADRGYINRLDFKVDQLTATVEDHPNYIDVVKLLLPQPLAPGATTTITTPFHVQLPYNFSRGGHVGQSYQVTQWYPKPAVYDAQGWHPMPYLDQGEFYSEFGSYDVQITLPANYKVAATGELQDSEERGRLQGNTQWPPHPAPKAAPVAKPGQSKKPGVKKDNTPPSSAETKTLIYKQGRIHDFAWFADKNFVVKYDTVQLTGGHVVDCYAFYLPAHDEPWKKSIGFIKNALRFRSQVLGTYPYRTATVVDAAMGFPGGMEYPTITSISGKYDDKSLDMVIEHELGHNWFYGILASNERKHPWMDEGMNSYYDNRYEAEKYPPAKRKDARNKPSLEFDEGGLLHIMNAVKRDQPIETPSEKFSEINYGLVAYAKTAQWMQLVENSLGTRRMDSMMQRYYAQWQFKHPQPADFDSLLNSYGGGNWIRLRSQTGELPNPPKKKKTPLPPALPILGFNQYDGFMAGAVIHNYNLPVKKYHVLLAPMYAFKSKQVNGLARLTYNWYPQQMFYRIDAGIAASRFGRDAFKDRRSDVQMSFLKLAPFVRFTLAEKEITSTRRRTLQLKHYNLREDLLDFKTVQTPTDTFDMAFKSPQNRYVNQIQLRQEDSRALYPYALTLQVEHTKEIIRTGITAEQYFNYNAKDGGLQVRFFAGKLSYTGNRTVAKEIAADIYNLNMTGPKGENDYTYSDYFLGRNEFEGSANQQIMLRDGAFKFRTDLLASQPGRTDNWLAAINLSSDIPDRLNPLSVLPIKIPIKLFADIGTYAEAWEKNTDKTRFLFDAGLQLSLFKGVVNVYLPLIYSKEFSDYSLQINGKKRSFKNLSFALNLQNTRIRNWIPQINF